MDTGYMQDLGYGLCVQVNWLSGEPEDRTFLGMKNGIKYRKDGLAVKAWRCGKCGLLELNAPPKEA
jgi:hypothetical protein